MSAFAPTIQGTKSSEEFLGIVRGLIHKGLPIADPDEFAKATVRLYLNETSDTKGRDYNAANRMHIQTTLLIASQAIGGTIGASYVEALNQARKAMTPFLGCGM